MSLTLQIELDGRGPFRPGDDITGTVIASSGALVRCDGLVVQSIVYTHGKGNRHVGPVKEQRLFEGDLPPGEHRFPFRVPLPTEPAPYHGELMNVEMGIRATADIPWTIDPEVSVPVVTVIEPKTRGYRVDWDRKEERANHGIGCLVLAGVLLAVGAALIGLAALTGSREPIGLSIAALSFGAIGLVFGVIQVMAERRVGTIRLRIDQKSSASYREGTGDGFLDVSIAMRPDANPHAVRTKIIVQEVVVKGSGSNKTTHRHTFHEADVVLEPSGEPGRYRGRVPLPAPGAAPGTIKLPSNEIVWKLTAHVEIADWPDWNDEIPLTVKAV